jgi:hypothetical protein
VEQTSTLWFSWSTSRSHGVLHQLRVLWSWEKLPTTATSKWKMTGWFFSFSMALLPHLRARCSSEAVAPTRPCCFGKVTTPVSPCYPGEVSALRCPLASSALPHPTARQGRDTYLVRPAAPCCPGDATVPCCSNEVTVPLRAALPYLVRLLFPIVEGGMG